MEGRKKKYAYQRCPQEGLQLKGLAEEISLRTGFRKEDVSFVIRTFINVFVETLTKKQYVKIPGLGCFFGLLRESRVVNDMAGGTNAPKKIIAPARFITHFRVSQTLRENMNAIEPTKEDFEYMYHPKE